MYCVVGHFANLAELITVEFFVGFFGGVVVVFSCFFFFLGEVGNIAVNWYVSSREFSVSLHVSWCVCEAFLLPTHV